MDDSQERIERICRNEFVKKDLNKDLLPRLNKELQEIFAQAEEDYLLDLHDKSAKFSSNENNLLTVYLLGLVDDFNASEPSVYVQGESPDVDIDYIPIVRDYLKNEWAAKTFGNDKVCSIGTYGTLGIKMALKDMTRVFGLPRDEIELITKKIPDKDDDGHELEWERALELVPELKDYCDRNSELSQAVEVLIGRNKSGGVHAGGLIISSVPIADFVPLEVRSVKKDNKFGIVCSAWGEGLRTQDLGAVGLVKFDLLIVGGILQIGLAANLIKIRHGLDKICNLPGQLNWSDTGYLEDKKVLALAAKGDTKRIFQLGSEGIRKLISDGGVDSFHDIPAYSALYRPGPMNCLPGHTEINISKGKKPLKSLNPFYDKIQYVADDGSVKSTHEYFVSNTGKKKIIKIKTKSGKVIFSSFDHRFLVSNKEYVEARKLTQGMALAVKL